MKEQRFYVITHAPHLTQLPKPAMGLGDVVKKVLTPFTKTVDKVFGSKLTTCTPCAKRQAKLNQLMPDITKPLS